jgi:hypothetical protein
MNSKLTSVRISVDPDFEAHTARIIDGVPESMVVAFTYETRRDGQWVISNYRKIKATPLSAKRIGVKLERYGFKACPGYMWPGWIDVMYVKFQPYVIGMSVNWNGHDGQNPVSIDEVRGDEVIVTDCWDESYWVPLCDLSVPVPIKEYMNR